MERFRAGPRSELDRVDHKNLSDDLKVLKSRHEKFCNRILGVLPSGFTSLESNRMTVVFFAVSSLDVLGSLDSILSPDVRKNVVDWIYRVQVFPDPEDPSIFRHGFRGSTTFRVSPSRTTKSLAAVDGGHLAMTYTALATLVILGDDLSGVDRAGVVEGVRKLQLEDGSFIASPEAAENDMRFVFCASAVCSLIGDWSGMQVERAADFIKRSLRYDGGVAQRPGLESHGGSTFCALAALTLMGRLETTFNAKERDRIRRWCLFRLHQGFQGRPNKPDDTCYTFWIGASLKMLCVGEDGPDFEAVISSVTPRCHKFVLNTQDPIVGGFAKWPVDGSADPLHTYLGLNGLSLSGYKDPDCQLSEVFAPLNISQKANDHLNAIHKL